MDAIGTDASEPRVRARILIVDDERSLVGVLAMVLGDAGYEFVTAYDGETALRRIRDDPPDLVLLSDLRVENLRGVGYRLAPPFSTVATTEPQPS